MDDLIQDFIAETREGLEALDCELVRLEQDPGDPQLLGGIFRLIHTIKGTSGFLSLARLQTVAHAAENVLGAFRDGELQVTAEAVSAILETVDLIRTLIDGLAQAGHEPAGDDAALIRRLEAVLQASPTAPASAPAAERPLIDRLGGDAAVDAASEMVMAQLSTGDLGAVFTGCDLDLVQFAIRDAAIGAARQTAGEVGLTARLDELAPGSATAAPRVAGHLADALMVLGADEAATAALLQAMSPVPAAEAVAPPGPPPPTQVEAASGGADVAGGSQTIRVSVDALEHLMTVVSELVLIRNQLIQALRLEPESPFAAPLHRLNQVTSELQEGVMTTRMQPISGAWAKLPRLVRDLANDLGKQIDLVMIGHETELDRQVLELIKDPLTHMIRNAADHGIESPEERRAVGKKESGRITLSARHEGGAIVIEVADDGRGLNAAGIRAKALAAGLISAAQAEALSDADARQFIFAAGLSTAREVTAVSGRGVGMDVVRTNIEKIGGAIELASTEGAGSRFIIRIPLTLTIVSTLIVECCGERFAVPQSSVTELVSANDASGHRIEYLNGAAVLRLRDRLLPLVSLQELLKLDPEQATMGETCIVVAKVGAFSFGIIVDRVFDTEEIVVKPVATVLRHLKLYSGATIMGDGSVILILDPKGISLEAGAAQAGGALEAAAEAADATAPTTAMLLFRARDGSLRAAPLGSVSRIEEAAAADLERVDGRTVLQYRGRLMPVVVSGDGGPALQDGDVRPLLVFARGEQSIGLLVDEVVDIVETLATADLEGSAGGSAGSLIIDGKATELIDVDHYWRRAQGAGPTASALPSAPPARRRVLVIEPDPMSQMMLRPLLNQAGYDVVVASGAEEAETLHAAGETFGLIMIDTNRRDAATRAVAETLARSGDWRAIPILGHDALVNAFMASRGPPPSGDEDLRGAA